MQDYKNKLTEINDRIGKLQKAHDRQTVIYEQKMEELKTLGIADVSELDSKIEELNGKVEKNKAKLGSYLEKLESKISSIEELLG